LVGFGVGWALVLGIFRGPERRFLLTLFLASFAVRLAAAVAVDPLLVTVTHDKSGIAHTWVGYLFEDDRAYDKTSWGLAGTWLGLYEGVPATDFYLLKNYTYMIAVLYYFLGHELIAAKFLNCLFGALTPVAMFALGNELGGTRAGRVSALCGAFFPSLVLWSVINLKDILVVLLITLIMYGALRFARAPGLGIAAATLLAFATIENMRLYVFYAFAWLMPIAFFLINRSPWRRRLAIGLPYAVAILSIAYLMNQSQWLGLRYLTDKRQEALASSREFGAGVAESGIELDKIPRSEGGWAIQLTNAVRVLPYVLFAPFPWTATRLKVLAIMPEMFVWYGVEALGLLSLWLYRRQRWRQLFLPVVYVGGLVFIFSLIEGNVGTIYRHRAMLAPPAFAMAGLGLVWLEGWWTTRRVGVGARRMAGVVA